MNANEIIQYISKSEKKTPVKVYIKERAPIPFENCKVFGCTDRIVFGEWSDIKPMIEKYAEDIEDIVVESDRRNSAIPMLDTKDINARIEPGAIIREHVTIGEHAVVMMGAVINIGAVIGDGSMIDMNAVLGGRATVGKNCHIGAGSVLAGVVEPPCAKPVIIEDDVLVGANAVVLEGVRVGKGAVVAAGAIVIEDVPDNAVVAGIPAKLIKMKDEKAKQKTALVDALRDL
jgi:2,3,4,5-tetrahydropyridine-2-carboxylate N-succinyltransferase/tetrahydrodipicolinate N-acetyltransferase